MNERNIIETQPERTDLPLIVIPVIVESMIEPFAANFPLLHDIARIRMHCDFTLDTDTILERTKDAEAVIVIGFHITDDILDAMTVRGHVSCFAFGGTGSSQYLNDWSAVRVKDPALKKRMSEIGRQPYIAEAPLLYVFVADEHRNAIIAESKGVPTDSDTYGLAGSYRFSQAQNDAVLALHAMETAAYSLGLGCVILGSLLNDVPGLIEALHLPQYTYPVLGLAIGKPDQAPALKPRMPRELQFFDDVYPSDDDATESIKERIGAFDVSVHEYYDLRNTDRPVDAFSDQIASIAAQRMDATHQVIPNATSQGFRLDR